MKIPCTFTSKPVHSENGIVKKNNYDRLISKEKQRRRIMVNDTVIRNFFYTSTPEHEGVLFHIPSGRFFRVFDEKCKSDFRQIFEIVSLSEDVLEILHKIY